MLKEIDSVSKAGKGLFLVEEEKNEHSWTVVLAAVAVIKIADRIKQTASINMKLV